MTISDLREVICSHNIPDMICLVLAEFEEDKMKKKIKKKSH